MATTMPAPTVPAARDQPSPVLRTLVVCDLVDSTALVERIGDARAAALFRRHDRAARDLIERHRGREIDKTDGFLLLFERPVEALAFALGYQRLLRDLSTEEDVALKARVGVHVGEVQIYENAASDVARGAKRVEVEGLVKPVAARLMGLALPGQILVSAVVQGLTQRAEPELRAAFPGLAWRAHGRYAFKGVPQPMAVHEVGEAGVAPLLRPIATEKAWRARPIWLRPRTLLAELALIVAVGALVLWFATRTQPAIAFAERDSVVVGDLRNLTGDARFDESLDVALRISLEQSRFVNLVSDLQVRDSLQRMQRPLETAIDRATGAEIALREGARALILPTVAEIGGRLRVSAEVVDPHTQTTVYTETADGSGAESALSSIDQVTARLRARLGEAVRTIERDSAPLPKVATDNLDALRAYALGTQAMFAGRHAEGGGFFEEALRLDPEFALAEVGLARVHYNASDVERAEQRANRALARADRLPPRDRVYVEAWSTIFRTPLEMVERWARLGALYPDHYAAYYNHAAFDFRYFNRTEAGLAALAKADSDRYPGTASTRYAIGMLLLADDRPREAIAAFKWADEAGLGGTLTDYVAAHAALRDYRGAEALLARDQSTGVAGHDLYGPLAALLLDVDRGRIEAALAMSESLAAKARDTGAVQYTTFEGLRLSLAALARGVADDPALAAYVERLLESLGERAEPRSAHAAFGALHAALLALREGEAAAARKALAHASLPALREAFPNVAKLAAVLEAELALAQGDAARAIELAIADAPGRPIVQAHVATLRASRAEGRLDDARREAEWLDAHRGQAFAEWGSASLGTPYNVASANLALLDLAEIEADAEDPGASASALARFLAAWPEATLPAKVAARVKRLRADGAPPAGSAP